MRVLDQFLYGIAGGFLGRRVAVPAPRPPSSLRLVAAALGLTLGVFVGIVLLIRIGAPRYQPVRKLLAPIEAIIVHEPEFVPADDADIQALLETDAGVPLRDWTSIVLHHSATAGGSAASFDAYHRTHNGWKSLGYDFVIGNGNEMPDGAVEAGPRWRRQQPGAHANSAEYNNHGIGICLVGNFDIYPPTEKQLASARALVDALARRFRIPAARVYGHGQIREGGGTACPGKLFPMAKLKDGLPR